MVGNLALIAQRFREVFQLSRDRDSGHVLETSTVVAQGLVKLQLGCSAFPQNFLAVKRSFNFISCVIKISLRYVWRGLESYRKR